MPEEIRSKPADFLSLSQKLWYAVRTGDGDVVIFQEFLEKGNTVLLERQLINDAVKKAFWINLYNAFMQWILLKHPEMNKYRNRLFNAKFINLCDHLLSLDDIEHGMLRRSKIKWSGGYLSKCFPGNFEKTFRVDKPDYRIHFTLNCGAKSCPSIRFYTPGNIDDELNIATKNYLENEVIYEEEKNVLQLPAIMSWYRGDFGGKNGMLQLCRRLELMPENVHPVIRLNKYDWTLLPRNYKN